MLACRSNTQLLIYSVKDCCVILQPSYPARCCVCAVIYAKAVAVVFKKKKKRSIHLSCSLQRKLQYVTCNIITLWYIKWPDLFPWQRLNHWHVGPHWPVHASMHAAYPCMLRNVHPLISRELHIGIVTETELIGFPPSHALMLHL